MSSLRPEFRFPNGLYVDFIWYGSNKCVKSINGFIPGCFCSEVSSLIRDVSRVCRFYFYDVLANLEMYV